jgi:CHAT domain-containing protein
MTRGATALILGVLLLAVSPGTVATQQDAVPLARGQTLERTLAGAERQAFDVTLNADDFVAVTADQHDVDLVIRLVDPSGNVVALFDDEMRKDARERAAFVADASRAYRLTIAARYPLANVTRGYSVRIDEQRPATDRDRTVYQSRTLMTEATALRTAGKFDEALDKATQAEGLAESASGASDAYVASLLSFIGSVQRSKGRDHDSEQTFLRAIASSEAALGREHPQTGSIIELLGLLYNAQEDYARAEPLMTEGTAIVERTLGESPKLAGCLMDLAVLHMKRGDDPRALTELQRAAGISDKTMSPDEFGAIAIVNNRTIVLTCGIREGEAAPSAPRRRRADARARQLPGRQPAPEPAIIAREQRDFAKAHAYIQRAYDIRARRSARSTRIAATLIVLGNLYHVEGEYQQALDTFQRAYDVLERTAGPYHSFTLMAINNAARTYTAQGNLAAALDYQSRYDALLDTNIAFNLAIGSERDKVNYLDSTFERMGRAISLHLRRAPASREAADLGALAILRRKGRVLDALADSRAALRERLDPADRAVLDEWSDVSAQLSNLALKGPGRTPYADYRKALADLEQRRDGLEARMSGRSASFLSGHEAVSLEAIRAALPAGAALIEFAVYQPFDPAAVVQSDQHAPPRYAAYVIRRDAATRGVDLGPESDVNASVAALREALRNPARADVYTLARKTDALVLRPVRALTGGARRLLISPDGALNLLPFETLVDEHGRFQVERYAITYLGSGRDLLRMQAEPVAGGAPLVIADPAFGDEGPGVYFTPLSGTAREAVDIGRLLPGAAVLTGDRATKTALTHASRPPILHIASHAFFISADAPSPAPAPASATSDGLRGMTAKAHSPNPLLRSGIALAGANLARRNGDAGILTALEASTLDLRGTELVTLSACDTGVGDVKNGEGVYGLRRGFFLAGAETIVMSLWPVSDYVTHGVMTKYYAGLARGEGRGAALRRVQLAMIADSSRRHPFYWAGSSRPATGVPSGTTEPASAFIRVIRVIRGLTGFAAFSLIPVQGVRRWLDDRDLPGRRGFG